MDEFEYLKRDLATLEGVAFALDCDIEHSARQRRMLDLINSIRENINSIRNVVDPDDE